MKYKILVFLSIFASSIISAVEPTEIADRFDYPIGERDLNGVEGNNEDIGEQISECGNGLINLVNDDKCRSINITTSSYNKEKNEQYRFFKNIYRDSDRASWSNEPNSWYNVNDVGAFGGGVNQRGLHPGEDWNHSGGDAGLSVYAVANGVVESISSVEVNARSRGWQIIIKHKMPDNSRVYSIYLHVSPNIDGGLNGSTEDQFPFQEGVEVLRGARIAHIATGMTVLVDEHGVSQDHLHFEMRTKFDTRFGLYSRNNTHANRNGYYTNSEFEEFTFITIAEVKDAFKLMKKDGIIDPSDFIDNHRNLVDSDENNQQILSVFDGSGSVIVPSEKCFAGCSKDYAKMQPHPDSSSTVSFQWKTNDSNCTRFHLIQVDENFKQLPPNKLEYIIQRKHWDGSSYTNNYQSTYLPTTLELEAPNTQEADYDVVSITSVEPLTESIYVMAACTKTTQNPNYAFIKSGRDVVFNDSNNNRIRFGGSGSVITVKENMEKNLVKLDGYDDKETGVKKDFAAALNNGTNTTSFVVFQWRSSKHCPKLKIIGRNETEGDVINISKKLWYAKSWNTVDNCNHNIPCTIESSDAQFHFVKIEFNLGVFKGNQLKAVCEG